MNLTFAVPGDLNTLTGGYVYDKRLLAELRALGLTVEHLQLPASFPFATAADVAQTQQLLQVARAPLLIDGLAFGALPEVVIKALPRPLLALCHHPIGLETGLSAQDSTRLIANETAVLAYADQIIVTSPVTADTLVSRFAVPRASITIAVPGTDPAPQALAYAGGVVKTESAPVQLFAAGSIIPRKAYDVLVAALAGLPAHNWHLRLAGSPARAPETARALYAQIAAAGLGDKIEIIGELTPAELAREYGAADVFVMPSLYEGFGMVLAEAMACGLPLVASTDGAAARTVPDNCGLKVPPGDVAALRAALAKIVGDRALRHQLAAASWRHGQTLARWPDTAAIVAGVIGRLAA